MSEITTIFWDVGGVMLSNGWDTNAREAAAEKFGLDWDDFQERHDLIVPAFEIGQIDIDEYLDQTIFHTQRDFDRDTFKDFMFSCSQPIEGGLDFVAELAASEKYVMATLNNESYAINRYRIETFELKNYFSAFFSSCFVGVKKPDSKLFQTALEITQRYPEECLFVDDRSLNLETADKLGLHTVHCQNPQQMREAFAALGVTP